MAMLKTAYQYGQKLAFDEGGLSPEQMGAAARLGGLGGGLLGAGIGGGLGTYLGGRLGENYDWDPATSRLIGGGLGALLGGGIGGYAGSQAPHLKGTKPEAPALEPASLPPEEALGLLQTIPGFGPGFEPSYPGGGLGFLDDSGFGGYY